MEISACSLMIPTINGSKYCVKQEQNAMHIVPRRQKYLWSGADTPSDVAGTVNINAVCNMSLTWWQLTPNLKTVQGISFLSIVMVYSQLRSTLLIPCLLNPSVIAQIAVYHACHTICLLRKLFLSSYHRTSILENTFSKCLPWNESGCPDCSKCC